MAIENYLYNHQIIQIGIPPAEYICCDTIIDNPDELISVIQDTKYYISHIRWWDYIKKGSISPIGYGGAEDPNNTGYYFAETDISKNFNSFTTPSEYREYIAEIKMKYSDYRIFPAFDIKKRNEGKTVDGVCKTGDGLREPY